MNIGEPLRTIVVEPLELPVKDPDIEHEPEPAPLEPEPEHIPASSSHSMASRGIHVDL